MQATTSSNNHLSSLADAIKAAAECQREEYENRLANSKKEYDETLETSISTSNATIDFVQNIYEDKIAILKREADARNMEFPPEGLHSARKIRKLLGKIDVERAEDLYRIKIKVLVSSCFVALSCFGVVGGAVATPFAPVTGVPVLAGSVGCLSLNAAVLHSYNRQKILLSEIPSALIQQKAKEEEMFPGVEVTIEQKNQAYNAVVEDEEIRKSVASSAIEKIDSEAKNQTSEAGAQLKELVNLGSQLAAAAKNTNDNNSSSSSSSSSLDKK